MSSHEKCLKTRKLPQIHRWLKNRLIRHYFFIFLYNGLLPPPRNTFVYSQILIWFFIFMYLSMIFCKLKISYLKYRWLLFSLKIKIIYVYLQKSMGSKKYTWHTHLSIVYILNNGPPIFTISPIIFMIHGGPPDFTNSRVARFGNFIFPNHSI